MHWELAIHPIWSCMTCPFFLIMHEGRILYLNVLHCISNLRWKLYGGKNKVVKKKCFITTLPYVTCLKDLSCICRSNTGTTALDIHTVMSTTLWESRAGVHFANRVAFIPKGVIACLWKAYQLPSYLPLLAFFFFFPLTNVGTPQFSFEHYA